jgi:hypothetical protein
MYADDPLLSSCSVVDLQAMINICIDELAKLYLSLNVNKCFCLKVGRRFKADCGPLSAEGRTLQSG